MLEALILRTFKRIMLEIVRGIERVFDKPGLLQQPRKGNLRLVYQTLKPPDWRKQQTPPENIQTGLAKPVPKKPEDRAGKVSPGNRKVEELGFVQRSGNPKSPGHSQKDQIVIEPTPI